MYYVYTVILLYMGMTLSTDFGHAIQQIRNYLSIRDADTGLTLFETGYQEGLSIAQMLDDWKTAAEYEEARDNPDPDPLAVIPKLPESAFTALNVVMNEDYNLAMEKIEDYLGHENPMTGGSWFDFCQKRGFRLEDMLSGFEPGLNQERRRLRRQEFPELTAK